MNEFSIRPYQLEDVAEIYMASAESRDYVGKWMGWMTPDYSRKDAQNWVEHAVAAWERGSEYEHVIVDVNNQGIVGSCGLNCLNRKDLVGNLGYWSELPDLVKERQNKPRFCYVILDFGP